MSINIAALYYPPLGSFEGAIATYGDPEDPTVRYVVGRRSVLGDLGELEEHILVWDPETKTVNDARLFADFIGFEFASDEDLDEEESDEEDETDDAPELS